MQGRYLRAPAASRLLLFPALLFAAGVGRVAAQEAAQHDHEDHDHAVEGGGSVPAGWTVRTDESAPTTNVKVVPMGGGIHVTLGPAIILYRAQHTGSGPFHTLATFTQTKPAAHAEGYGLFYGGKDLAGAGQYTYFLIRQDGRYVVKRRDGQKTTDVTKGWVESSAVHKADAKGSSTNKLEIDNKSDRSKVVFVVNGEPVYTLDAKATTTDGTVGLRVNHNLDLHVDGFDVHR